MLKKENRHFSPIESACNQTDLRSGTPAEGFRGKHFFTATQECWGSFLRQIPIKILRLDNQQAFHAAMAEATGMAAFK